MDPQPIDLSSCDREPIHIPGSIQPHGFLLALDAAGKIRIASRTAGEILGKTPGAIFGATVGELLGEQGGGGGLEAQLAAEPLTSAPRLLSSFELQTAAGAPERLEVVAHRAAGTGATAWTILEFERSTEPLLQSSLEAINARLYNFIATIRRTQNIDDICQAAVDEIRALTLCDRVVLYSFDAQGHGQVLAESRAGDQFASYLGLRFPASDVPAQARRMYELNRVRIIPDVDYEPSPLLDASGPAPEIDLSSSVLRSVSPIHREYMRNMGTVCSMSVSILIDGKLWGLVSCHHHSPRYVPLRLRAACDFLMQVTASQIESRQKSMHLERALEAKSLGNRLLAAMAAQENYMDGLTQSSDLLLEMLSADGAAVVAGARALLFGITPSEPQVLDLLKWLRQAGNDEFFVSSRLSSHYPEAEDYASKASGVVVVGVSKLRSTYVLWFRQEQVQTVRWAGDPAKTAQTSLGAVHPRHSFSQWTEIVRGSSVPWLDEQIEAAHEFRGAILEIVLGRAEELAEMAAGLQLANTELEAFSYSISHDLRAPFRHISGFSRLLREAEGERMGEQGRHYLEVIESSARFAGQLVDGLLDFSRLARTVPVMVPVDLARLADSEWQAVLAGEAQGDAHRRVEFSRTPLPTVVGDPQLLRQVLRNLFSNAVKYTARQPAPFIRVEATERDGEYIVSIRDNGVGFDQQYAGKLFGVFQRLHRIEEFEGTGIGLANVRRIVGRHGGRAWAEGEVGKGATFFFSLPIAPNGEQGTDERFEAHFDRRG